MPPNRDTNIMRRLSVLPPNFFMKYYKELDAFLSLAGILKIVSVVLCVLWCVVTAWSPRRCSWQSDVMSVAGSSSAASVSAVLFAATALRLPLRAPLCFFYTDIITCGVSGVTLLVIAVYGIVSCEHRSAPHYIQAVVSLSASCSVVSCSVATYAAVSALWDGARPPLRTARPPRAATRELEV